MPRASKRLVQVPLLSSAARIPLPGATMRAAMSSRRSAMGAIPRYEPGRVIDEPHRIFTLGIAGWKRPLETCRTDPQDFDAGEGFTFEPFQERAAGRRDEREIVGDAGVMQGRHRLAATGNRKELAGFG